jgi:hypothetical protein
MRLTVAGILVVLALVLSGREYVSAADDLQGAAVGYRLVYFFSPDELSHCQRAARLLSWVDQPGGPVEMIGIVPLDCAAVIRQSGWVGTGFTVAVDTDLTSVGLPADLMESVPAGPDCALLLDGDNRVVWAVPGAKLAVAGGQSVATDIDKSTWGKVKELFR